MWRYLPLVGAVLLVVIAVVVRPLIQLRRHGTLGVYLFTSRSPAQIVRDLLLVALAGTLIWQAWQAARRPPQTWIADTLGEGPLLDLMQMAGAIVMVAGIVLLAVSQLNLGASWRIGIDESSKPGLVTSGLYRFSRNPIYLGLLATIAGYTLLLPTPLSLLLLIGAYIGVRLQTSAEEAYLLRTYGDAYRAYAARVGRFLPRLRR
jgi:protein-S-isoprenylcysteine O-methyltransferase Ste14